MMRTLEAIIDEQGIIRLLKDVHLLAARRALVTILEDEPGNNFVESALLSEAAPAQGWSRHEEDAAWAHLQWAR